MMHTKAMSKLLMELKDVGYWKPRKIDPWGLDLKIFRHLISTKSNIYELSKYK